jgi:hypothetical protein
MKNIKKTQNLAGQRQQSTMTKEAIVQISISVITRLVFIGLLAMTTLAPAQTLFRGRPAPDCSTFFIMEVGSGAVFTPTTEAVLTTEHGIMFNLNTRYALGGTLYWTSIFGDQPVGRLGFKARGRRWLSQNWSIDVGTGLLLAEKAEFTGSTGLNYKDLFILNVGVDVLRSRNDDRRYGANLRTEIKGGSYVGAGLHGAALVGFLVMVVYIIASGGIGD